MDTEARPAEKKARDVRTLHNNTLKESWFPQEWNLP